MRALRPEDLPAATALLRAAGLPVEGVVPGPDFVAVFDDEGLVGLAGVERCAEAAWLLRSVVVAPRARGRGLGRALVADRITWAEGRALWLLTTTAADWFEGLGFRRTARAEAPPQVRATDEFARLCPDSAVCMAL
ncbi:MAG: GNAT family N-acetyltransferase [Alphaproteobacteria bacterium]|nr:GNAT family N-acetyltransferase [Alphaproteobacteria bacterium]